MSPFDPISDPHSEEIAPDEIQRALHSVLNSQQFRKSAQCSSLLRYIVRHTLNREDNLLRERVIGASVFGRAPEYEPGEDPVVRLRVSEVRKRLAQYYLQATDAVQIDIPSGGYKAVFIQKTAALAPIAEPEVLAVAKSETRALEAEAPQIRTVVEESLAATKAHAGHPIHWKAIAISLISLIAMAGCAFLWGTLHRSAYDRFWQPWGAKSKPVLLSIGANAVYRFRWDYMDQYAREHNLQAKGQEFYLSFKPTDSIPGADILPAYNSFVAIGDVTAVAEITRALTRHSLNFQVRYPDDISFAEVRSNPSILIGGFNNPMTLELTRNLPFIMRSGSEIDETQPPNRRWTLHVDQNSHDTADYAIVTRLIGNGEDQPLMSVAGLGSFGTLSAARLISDPKAIEAITSKLPKGWEKMSFQVVVGLKISDFKVTNTEILATRAW